MRWESEACVLARAVSDLPGYEAASKLFQGEDKSGASRVCAYVRGCVYVCRGWCVVCGVFV